MLADVLVSCYDCAGLFACLPSVVNCVWHLWRAKKWKGNFFPWCNEVAVGVPIPARFTASGMIDQIGCPRHKQFRQAYKYVWSVSRPRNHTWITLNELRFYFLARKVVWHLRMTSYPRLRKGPVQSSLYIQNVNGKHLRYIGEQGQASISIGGKVCRKWRVFPSREQC